MKAFISEEFYSFFKKLADNNHKEWFDEHRSIYEKEVKIPFENLCELLLNKCAVNNKAYTELRPKDVIFRINKDIRFSKDKTPYKLNRSALISPNGRKEMGTTGFYFELGPGENAFYSGVYMPEKPALAKIRNAIANNISEFNSIIKAKQFVSTFGEIQGEKNKRIDAELRSAGEIQPLIYNTQFYVKHEIPKEICVSEKLPEYLLELESVAKKLNDFLASAME